MKKLRQKDIAELAGVSPSTVSLLMKDPNTPRVSSDTRDRIFEIIRTNRFTGGSRHSQGDIVCTIPKIKTRQLEEFFYTSLLMMAEQTGQLFGYTVQLRSYSEFDELKPLTRDPGVAGIISINSSQLAEEFGSKKPVVAVNAVYTSACDVVKSHQRGSARDQVELLIRYGHRRIGFFCSLNSSERIKNPSEKNEGSAERFAGYCEGLFHNEIPVQADYCYQEIYPDFTMDYQQAAQKALNHFLGLPRPPTAIIAYNDMHAIYLLKAAFELGLQVPQDLSIIGNDNMEMGRYSIPALTTAEQDRAALGQVAVERLVQRIENLTKAAPQIISVPLKIIERESVGPPPDAMPHASET